MEPRRKRIRVLSSTESDSSSENGPSSQKIDIQQETSVGPQRLDISNEYDSDGNSSVESMDIIMYPSSSVLLKIEKSNSEKSESKGCNEGKLKCESLKILKEKSTDSKVSEKKPKNKESFNKSVEKKDLSKLKRKIVNSSETISNTKENEKPNHLQSAVRATCSYLQEKMSEPSPVGKKEQSSTERLYCKYLNNDDKLESSSKFQNVTTNLKDFSSNREFCVSVSQPCNSREPLSNHLSESNGINRNELSNTSLDLIKMVVNLDIKWLKQKEEIQKLPPNFIETESKYYPNFTEKDMELPLFYKSFDDYQHKYLSMLKIEAWEKICLSTKSNQSTTNEYNFTFSVDSYEYDFIGQKLMRLSINFCKSTVRLPAINSLILLKLKQQDELIKDAFGFIIKRHHHLVFSMIVKARTIPPQLKCKMEGKFACWLNKEVMQAEALDLLKFSPLSEDYLAPRWDTFSTSFKESGGDFFNIQRYISSIIIKEINLVSVPKIILLEGPPGSGKTSAIVSIAFDLLKNKNDLKKLLIVAPSHFALDEIGKKFLKSNESFKNQINFVRLGQVKNIHPELLNYSLNKHLEKYQMGYKKIEKILSNIPVILALPEDCWELRKFKVKFCCCLFDEVNQGTELDAIFPFALGITKILLVADHMQLPANVESALSLHCGYQRSVMQRFQSYFKNKLNKNPTIVLSKQFRVHSDVANFPFKHFYSKDYCEISSVYANKRSEFYPVIHYTVIDDLQEYGTEDYVYRKETGIDSVIDLCRHLFILDKDVTSSIGIIVPTEKEQREYRAAIVKQFPSSDIEVKTVDHFQGREKTIIILSCYHDLKKVIPSHTNFFTDIRKLNVALTRAITSLIICGPLHKFIKYYNIWSEIVTDSKNRSFYTYKSHETFFNNKKYVCY